jgi:hypothetical protein
MRPDFCECRRESADRVGPAVQIIVDNIVPIAVLNLKKRLPARRGSD